MKPWERRLKDLSLLLSRCHETYIEPELFRLATNQFVQTARTVTFILQKNQGNFPSFDWYHAAVQTWAGDTVMEWAKDSRNVIEKVGDLEINSTLRLTLLWSHVAENDTSICTGKAELLTAGTKRLVRAARHHLPSGIASDAAIKIERRWVANTLPQWELLQAFSYVYTTLYRLCQFAAARCGEVLDSSIPDPTGLLYSSESSRQVRYLKLASMKTVRPRHVVVARDPNFIFPPERLMTIENTRAKLLIAQNVDDVFEAMCKNAEEVFKMDGFHLPMVTLYDEKMVAVDGQFATFGDRADKFIFWRNVADRVVATKANLMVFAAEAWRRDLKNHRFTERMERARISGESLMLTALDASGNFRHASWPIIRGGSGSQPMLGDCVVAKDFSLQRPFFIAPLYVAFNHPYPDHIAAVLR